MIYVLASLHIKPHHREEFLQIFKANVPNVLKEDGCIEYSPVFDVATDIPTQDRNENLVTVVEKWVSLDALKAHAIAPHMLAYEKQVAGILENVSLKILTDA